MKGRYFGARSIQPKFPEISDGSGRSNRTPDWKVRKQRSTIWGGLLFSFGPVRSKIELSNWPFWPILNRSTSLFGPFSIFNMEENNYHCSFYGLLTADSSVLLVHPCAVTAGSQLFCRLRFALAFEKQFNCRENVFFFLIRKWCGKYLGTVCSK